MKTAYATCHLCEAICGIAVDVDGGRVVRIRGDERDPLSRGHICPKGVALADIQHDPDRLRAPMRRRGDTWEPVGWEEALDDVADRLAAVQRAHGRDAVGLYFGNPVGHSYGAMLYGFAFMEALKTRNVFSSQSIDALPRLLTSLQLYGNQAVLPIPDLDRTDFLLVLGANPAVSNGSVMTAPDARRRLQDVRARGGRVVVVDPRRSETAALADRHLFIRPGTDALLLLAMLHTLDAEGLLRPTALDDVLDNRERLLAIARPFAPERVAAATGISAPEIRTLAREFAAAPSAVCYGRLGTCTQAFGTTTSWLVDALNLLTGNMDRPGGAMFPGAAVDLPGLAARIGQRGSFARWRSRVRGLPEFNGELPVAAFADELETPGEGQIRALVLHAGNPVLSLPNGRRIDRALGRLDFVVAVDIYLNESTRHAHYVLPPAWGLENDHFALLFHALAVRNTVKFSPAVLEPGPDARYDWEILLALTTRLLAKRGLRGGLTAAAAEALGGRGPRRLLDLLLRTGAYGKGFLPFKKGLSLAALEAAPHGIDLGPLAPRLRQILGKRRVDLAPTVFTADVPRLEARLQAGPEDLVLIGRRSLRSNNSWMHNSLRLVKGPVRCTLLVHPEDARRRGLATGDRVRIATRTGEIEAPCEVSDEVMPGVVSLPHGWGHGRPRARLAVAAAHAGVSVNDVTDETRYDPVSGASDVNGVPVSVTRA
jgi:anaerobic selenocysteine-containing dehydrogenase